MEPDCAFYVGERARAYSAALREGEAAADACLEHTAPDLVVDVEIISADRRTLAKVQFVMLVVDVEITSADRGKAERYADMGVREMWRLHGRKGSGEFEAEFLALRPGETSRPLTASAVLEGIEPADVQEAVAQARFGRTRSERTEAMAHVMRRRRQRIMRIREEAPIGSTGSSRPEPTIEPS